jgi:hypothetical protein
MGEPTRQKMTSQMAGMCFDLAFVEEKCAHIELKVGLLLVMNG